MSEFVSMPLRLPGTRDFNQLPETNIFSENMPSIFRKQSYSKHPFSGANLLLVSRIPATKVPLQHETI